MVLTSIDLFCGAGGLSLGLEAAGFAPVLALDIDQDACATYERRFPHAKVACRSIVGYDFSQWRGVDLIAGGPPCQPFSNGGKRLASLDERDMLPEFIRAVNEARPRAFILENVPGLLAERNAEYIRQILSTFSSDYMIHPPRVVNAAEYGVPQKRTRVFILGSRVGAIGFPEATHTAGTYVSAGEALERMNDRGEENTSKVFYAKAPDLRPSPYAGQLFNGGGRPIDLSRPAPTILASAGGNKTHFVDEAAKVPPYHQHLMCGGKPRTGVLEGGRRITVKESATLQTFPKDFEFFGSRSSQYAQVGNAVPPRLAKIVGASIARGIH